MPAETYGQPPITALAFAPDGTEVVCGSQLGIEVRSWPSLQVTRQIDTNLGHVHDVAFSPGGDLLLAAGGAPSEQGRVEVFSWPGGELLYDAVDHEDIVYAVSWAADGSEFATAAGDEVVALWSAEAERRRTLSGHSRRVLAVAYLAKAELLVSAGVDQSLRVWDRSTGELVRTLDNHTDVVRDLAVRPGDHALAMIASAGADRTLRFWQPEIGRLVRFARLPGEPLAIAWTGGGERLVVACTDGHMRVIDPDTLEIVLDQLAVEGWAYEVAVAPDGRAAAVAGSGGQIRRLELDSW
jgi:WD40 repeat protein